VNYDNSLVVTITVTCNLGAPSGGDHLFICGAIYLPPQFLAGVGMKVDFPKKWGTPWTLCWTKTNRRPQQEETLTSLFKKQLLDEKDT